MCSFFPCKDKLKTSLNLPGVLISSLQGYLAAYNKSQTMGDSCQKKERRKNALNNYLLEHFTR